MRRRTRRLLLWIGIGISVSALSVTLPIYVNKECHYDPETYEEHCARQNVALFFFAEMAEIIERRDKIFTVLGTIAIACFTGTLWWATDKLWQANRVQLRASLRVARRQSKDTQEATVESRRAANAANRSAEAFMSAEMAHLFTEVKTSTIAQIVAWPGMWDKSHTMFDEEVDTPGVGYFFVNTGKTVAILKELSHQLVLLEGDFPKSIDYIIAENMPEHRVIMPGQPGSTIGCLLRDTMTVGKCVDFQKRKLVFWFYGYAKFDDVFGREHEWRYRFRYRRGDDGFRLDYFREFPGPTDQGDA